MIRLPKYTDVLYLSPEVGKILEALVLEYEFAGTRTRTRE
jgi:hypothetical protein